MDIENPNTFKNILKGPINLFLGAGFSILSYDKDNKNLPLGKTLAAELREQFSLADLSTM